MRYALVAVLIAAAAPLAAQKPDTITAAILRAAATDTAQKIASYRTTHDTLWAVLVDPRTAAAREVRLERRGAAAAWARVSEKPVPLPSPARPQWVGDTAVAPAMQPAAKKKP